MKKIFLSLLLFTSLFLCSKTFTPVFAKEEIVTIIIPESI